jgi:drug/metabolite transporter (DMT)-like permease
MRLVLAALLLIIVTSFFHGVVADLLSFSAGAEERFYNLGIFGAAAMGGYGVILTVFGFVLSAERQEARIRLLPLFFMIVGTMMLFFYLFASSFNEPPREERLQPGDTITI